MSAPGIDGIVCFSTDPWGEMKRPGQLVRRLSSRVPVCYVEPGLSATSIIKNWRALGSPVARSRIVRSVVLGPHGMGGDVHVVSSLSSVPPQRVAGVLPTESLLSALARRQHGAVQRRAFRAASLLGMRAPIAWISYPMALAGVPADAFVVYDCMDRWSDFPDAIAEPRWGRVVARAERQLIERADVVLCSARGLYEARSLDAPGRTLLVQNGADVDHFMPRNPPVPDDIARLPRPLIGYVGAVADWLDFELIAQVARLRPDWSFVAVGPVFQGKPTGDARAMKPILGLPNVHLLGPRQYGDVPAYLEAFDAALIPFRSNGLTDDTNPIKVYEYLAAGVPVVSTPLPEVMDLPEVEVAADATDFAAAIERAVGRRHDPTSLGRRLDVARSNSWESRAASAWRFVHERRGTVATRVVGGVPAVVGE